jgi:hypothetical protein
VVAVEDTRQRQRLAERDRRCRRLLRLAGDERQPAAAPQGQQRGDRAAAEGAEESSAPQARRC